MSEPLCRSLTEAEMRGDLFLRCALQMDKRYESSPVLKLKHNETAKIMAELREQYGLENNTSILKLEELIKDNVGEIDYFDWSQYVLDKLCKVVSKYNKSTTQKNVSGCVLLLQILYFHRLKLPGIAQPFSHPLIQHWTHEKLKQRMIEEISAGDFGQWELDNSTYPISSSKVATEFEDEVLRERSSNRSCDEINEKSARFIKFTILKGELDNNEIHKLAKDEMHEAFLLSEKGYVSYHKCAYGEGYETKGTNEGESTRELHTMSAFTR
nr:hypothetical protein SOVF_127150 [Ipomoea batatas]